MAELLSVLVLASLALAACRSHTAYVKPAVDLAKSDRDHSYCRAYAEALASGQNFNLHAAPWLARQETEDKWMKLCMLERGYQAVMVDY